MAGEELLAAGGSDRGSIGGPCGRPADEDDDKTVASSGSETPSSSRSSSKPPNDALDCTSPESSRPRSSADSNCSPSRPDSPALEATTSGDPVDPSSCDTNSMPTDMPPRPATTEPELADVPSRPTTPDSEPEEVISRSATPDSESEDVISRPATPPPEHAALQNPFTDTGSAAAREWADRKSRFGERSKTLDKLIKYQGLERVKQQFLDIKSKVEICNEQGRDLAMERFNAVFEGNPGTGKTTVARLYGKFLHEMHILTSEQFQETSGIMLASGGAMAATEILDGMLHSGVLFIDEAYQLMADYVDGRGRQALDVVLTAMENNIGSLVVVFVGYRDQMESFFEHNPGLSSRIPYLLRFADFDDGHLWRILCDNIHRKYRGKMRIEGGLDGLNMRIAVRRIGQARGSRGFGNARAVENRLAQIAERQARRLMRWRRDYAKDGKGEQEHREHQEEPDCLLFTREDLIGPDPSSVAQDCKAWQTLMGLVGLDQVKECVRRMMGMIRINYRRELKEKKPLQLQLNNIFVGAPGTGKTTVAALYGQILAHLGFLSRGDVVAKSAVDFIGECLGKSEARTSKILAASLGKILVIDEAYMLDPGDPAKGNVDKFRAGVIDTIVSVVQGVPGEDRCIVLIGYQDKISDMFRHVNPGLARRFPTERPFRFANFDPDQLQRILVHKMGQQDLTATRRAIEAAQDVFERALLRPNFTNAGEVDSLLNTAKMNYETRQAQQPDRDLDGLLDAVDFDPDFDRGRGNNTDDDRCLAKLHGRVHASIIERLAGYQKRCVRARRIGMSPRGRIPTNFVFKGPPGTGKTTVAQSMGELFYGMGLLATKRVVECAATDLIGQYVGQTGPKTRAKLEEGLGHVLLIEEAYRLLPYGSQFATEALDELVHFLAHRDHAGRLVVILAGHTADMNQLMALQPTISGLFPEEIVFDNLSSEDCIALLARDLAELGTAGQNVVPILADANTEAHLRVRHLFTALCALPTWSNARDIKSLAQSILSRFLETGRALSMANVEDCMVDMIERQRDRIKSQDLAPRQPPLGPGAAPPIFDNPKLAPTPAAHSAPPISNTGVCMSGAGGCSTDRDGDRDVSVHQPPPLPDLVHQDHDHDHHRHNHLTHNGQRVSDETWRRLTEARTADVVEDRQLKADMARLTRKLQDAKTSRLYKKDIKALEKELSAVKKRTAEKKSVQEALRQMGRCQYGFSWTPVSGGYECGGGCFVSDADVQHFMSQ